MNKTAIKNFAIWARNKLIADITYKAGLLGVTDKKVKEPLSSSTKDVLFFDIGTTEPYAVTGIEIEQRKKLAEIIEQKAKQSDYATAYKTVVEEVAYTWFNRLIAVRFMEVNDYLPYHIRVLSSESTTKIEPDLVTTPFDAGLDFTPYEKDRIVQLKNDNQLDELFRMLFIKQCNALNEILPELFETTSDYTELLLNINFTDKDGVVYRLVHDISEDDFNVSKEGQVEIIGWLYQYYNTELNEVVYDGNMSKSRVPKELLPAATTIYTPDWVIRYMVENSLGRLWLEGHPNDALKTEWRYYLNEVQQEENVQKQLEAIRKEYITIKPEDIKVIDPCMGSGHILVYAFDVLMQIYESCGYSQRDAAKSILERNLYGLDIDNRAYQLAYFAVMMKARQYNRHILNRKVPCHVYAIQESNNINRDQLKYFGVGMEKIEKNTAMLQVQGLLDTFIDAKEYGSILNVENNNWDLMRRFADSLDTSGQIGFDAIGIEATSNQLHLLIDIGSAMAQKYEVIVTNPPYLSSSRFSPKLSSYVYSLYPEVKSDLSMVMYKKSIKDFSCKYGFVSFITTTSWMYLKSFESLRDYIITHVGFDSLVDFGTELFDGKVGHNPIVAWVIRNHLIYKKMTGIRLIDYCYSRRDEKQREFFNISNRHFPIQKDFVKIPGIPIAYWVPDHVINLYNYPLISSKFVAKEGVGTRNDNVFLKMYWEVASDRIGKNNRWVLTDKAGGYRKWYLGLTFVMDWENGGCRIKNYRNEDGSLKSRPQNTQYLYREGVSWGKVGSGETSFRYREKGFAFNDAAPTLFGKELYPLLAALNSKLFMILLKIRGETLNVTCGIIEGLPLLGYVGGTIQKDIEYEVKNMICLSKTDWDYFETSWDFKIHPLVIHEISIERAYLSWQKHTEKQFNILKDTEEKLNRIFIDYYNLHENLEPEIEDKEVTVTRVYDAKEGIPESMKGNNYVLTKSDVIKSFISFAVGCMFGRYSLDVEGLAYAGGQWDNSKYRTFIPDKDNVLPVTDEEYFEDDIVGLFVAFVKKVYGAETLEENLDFIAEALGNKGDTSREVIRNYFLRDFFRDHCKTYQKRPIYWLFDSGKTDGFKALIYMHRYDENTIGNMRIDYLHRMQRVYESEIARMQETINNSTNAREVTAAEKRKEKLIKQLKETKDYDEKIAHLALARTPIDLDDGVRVNYEKVQTGTDGKKLDVMAGI